MKTFRDAAPSRALPAPVSAEAGRSPPASALEDPTAAASAHDWGPMLDLVRHSKTLTTPPQEEPSPAATSDVWRQIFPSLGADEHGDIRVMRAPVIDGPSLEEQAAWDAEERARPEHEHHEPDQRPRKSFDEIWRGMFGKAL